MADGSLTDDQLRSLIGNPDVTEDDLKRLSQSERVRFDALKQGSEPRSALQQIEDFAMKLIPSSSAGKGALLGGLVAPALIAAPATGGLSLPVAAAAAGLGGAGGAGLGMLTSALFGKDEPLPTTSTDVLSTMGTQGAGQAAGTLAGAAASAGLKATGNAIQATGIPRAVMRKFPGTAEALNKFRILAPTAAGKEKASGLTREAAANLQRIVDDAAAKGAAPITEAEIAPALAPSLKIAANEMKAGQAGAGGTQAVRDRLQAMMDVQGLGPTGQPAVPISDVPGIRRVLEKEGAAARKMIQVDRPATSSTSAAPLDISKGLLQVLRRRVPESAAATKQLQDLMGAEEASRLMQSLGLPLKQLSWQVPAAATAGALGLHNPLGALTGLLPVVTQTPQLSSPLGMLLYQLGAKLPWQTAGQVAAPNMLDAEK